MRESLKVVETNPYIRLLYFVKLLITTDEDEFCSAYKMLSTTGHGHGLWRYVNKPFSRKEERCVAKNSLSFNIN